LPFDGQKDEAQTQTGRQMKKPRQVIYREQDDEGNVHMIAGTARNHVDLRLQQLLSHHTKILYVGYQQTG